MSRRRAFVILLGAAAGVSAAISIVQHLRSTAGGGAQGGILIHNPRAYDMLSRLMLGPFIRRIGADIAAVAPDGGQVLEVGCGPGHLAILLTRRHHLNVTGVDLDPAMIARARENTDRFEDGDGSLPSFLVGDVASLAFPDSSYDLIVSTLSMHHWADPGAGLAEIGRVLRPGGRVLIWDFRPGARPHPFGPRYGRLPDAAEHVDGSPLRIVNTTPWRWPWRINLVQRIELVRAETSPSVDPGEHRSHDAATDGETIAQGRPNLGRPKVPGHHH